MSSPTGLRGRVGGYALKGVLDRLLAVVALVVSAPIWVIVAAAIKLEDGGPVFFMQERWGIDKKVIRVRKFRSMVINADRQLGAVQARENDPRITRVGRLLRATSCDELPQVLAILSGDMSWVGPRALPINEHQINEVNGFVPDEAIPGFQMRCAVRPGLTGLAQVYAPRDVRRLNKFRYDVLYVRKQSLFLDLRLIMLSLWITARGAWEQRGQKF